MRAAFVIAALLFLTLLAPARDLFFVPQLKTTDGREFNGVTVTAIDGENVRVRHPFGLATLPINALPPDVVAKIKEIRAVEAAEKEKAI